MAQSRASLKSFLGTIGWPLFWGAIATVSFYVALYQGVFRSEFLRRYTAGHPVEVVEVAMFFVGVAFLTFKILDLVRQLALLERIKLPQLDSNASIQSDCDHLIDIITNKFSLAARRSYFGQRLLAAIDHVKRKESSEKLDDELKYLSEMDAMRAHEGYAFVRMIIWATPMLGFLGTVIGITLALVNLNAEALLNSPKEAMEGLLAGLGVAFDTTALALTLAIVLMFAQFFSNQFENTILAAVDRRMLEELGRRFLHLSDSNKSDEKDDVISEPIIQALEQLVERHAKVWKSSLDQSNDHWRKTLAMTNDQVHLGIQQSLQKAASEHSNKMMAAELETAQRAADYWNKIHSSVTENAQALRDQQQELQNQSEILRDVMNASDQIRTLETTLNQNLKALAGAKNFEDTVMSLSAAIHLLSTRVGRSIPKSEQISLTDDDSQGRAA